MLYPFLSLTTMWFGSVYSDLGNSVPSKTSPVFVVILMMLPISALAFLRRRRISPWYPSSPEADMAFLLSQWFGHVGSIVFIVETRIVVLRPKRAYHYHLGPIIFLRCHAFSLSYKLGSVAFVLERR